MRSFNELLQSPRGLKALVVGGSALGALLLALLATPAFVRGKVQREARARGLEAEVESVRFGLGRIWLCGVRVTSPGDEFVAKLAAVSVSVFGGAVRGTGGDVNGGGDPAPLLRKLRGKSSGAGATSESGGRELGVEGLSLHWRQGESVLEASGAWARRADGATTLGADWGRAASGKRSVTVRGVVLGVATKDGKRQLTQLQTKGLELVLGSDAGASGRGAAPSEDAGVERAARLRELRGLAIPLLREGLRDGAELTLGGVVARVERGTETASFGPSRLLLSRDKETVRVSLVPSALEAGVTPLELNATLPLAGGGVHLVVKGGPVSLSSLGVQNGQLGLRDVERATLAADGMADFSEDFESVELDGKLAVHGLSLQRKELSPQAIGPWSFDAALKARARLDGSELKVLSSEAHWGEVRAELSGEISRAPGQRHVDGRLRVPLSGCQSAIDALPNGLLPLVHGVKLSGSFGLDLLLRYDLARPKDASVVLSVKNECKVREVPAELSAHRFERPFLREVKGADGGPVSIESGPGTQGWVPFDEISHHMESAILICEDAGFYFHAGFDFRALEKAFEDDLRQGRFARGASTVSMQLAKNLYLGKEKTLGRKLQEALLTMLLEQQLDKRRILELYLNVVELGPGLYGIGDAAQYYFAAPAHSLTLGQSLYLASLLPNPTYSHFGPDGKLNPGWQSYLRKLMGIAKKIKRIDESELQAGLEEEIAFRVPGTQPAPPAGSTDPNEAPAPPELDDRPPQR